LALKRVASAAVMPRSNIDAMSLMSAPAMKLVFAEATIAPRTAAFAASWSTQDSSSRRKSGVTTFIGRSTTSIRSTAMPSPSMDWRMFCVMRLSASQCRRVRRAR
jgi:hypothetical protein